ncbi:MAG: hypothetical protein JWO51_2344 [Rhodospirillales bacterium]|nr:hypothetical protein [Rhodospirillales bacterium]
MAQTTMSDAFNAAAEKLQDRVAALGDQANYQVRKQRPRAERALRAGYDEAARATLSIARSRSVQGWIVAGAIGLIIGSILLGRRDSKGR